MRLIHRDAGGVQILGMDLDEKEYAIKERIGFVYDDFSYYPDRKLETLHKVFSVSYSKWDEDRFQELAQRFELPMHRKIQKLSKGMKMKFSLALALSHNAELILMDEPTAGLDPVFRRELLDILAELMLDEDRSVLFSTHITSDLDRIADYVTIIDRGEIILSCSKEFLQDGWGLVKLPDADVLEGTALSIRGQRTGQYGVELLTDSVREFKRFLGNDVVIEKPTLEDMMVHLTKGTGHAEAAD